MNYYRIPKIGTGFPDANGTPDPIRPDTDATEWSMVANEATTMVVRTPHIIPGAHPVTPQELAQMGIVLDHGKQPA